MVVYALCVINEDILLKEGVKIIFSLSMEYSDYDIFF